MYRETPSGEINWLTQTVPRKPSRPGWGACAFAELTALAALAVAIAAFVMVLVFNARGLDKIDDADAAIKRLGVCCTNTTSSQYQLFQQIRQITAVNTNQSTLIQALNTHVAVIDSTNTDQTILIQLFNETLQLDLDSIAQQMVLQATQIYDLQQQVAALEATVSTCCP